MVATESGKKYYQNYIKIFDSVFIGQSIDFMQMLYLIFFFWLENVA